MPNRSILACCSLLLALMCAPRPASGYPAAGARGQGEALPLPEDRPVRAAHFPALSPDGETLCFSYLGDLWTVPSSGGTATRLTVHEAHDGYPRWSPDGRWIAFSSNRDSGFYDVYVVPAAGGEPRQLTHHSATDIVNDWSPDGTKILFYSGRGLRGFDECEVDVRSGVVKTVVRQEVMLRYASYSPDGTVVAYTRMPGPVPFWRPKYRGSGNAEIYLVSFKTGKHTRVTTYDGMDMWPMYAADGRTLFYVTDALNGTPNIARHALPSGKPSLVTRHASGAVRFPSIARDGSLIAYEHAGGLWTVDPRGGPAGGHPPTELRIYARTEGKTNLIQRLTLTSGATELELSPDGKTLALGLRGEIWTVPVEARPPGEATRVTNNPANDFDYFWSPDSARLAFVSDRNGPFNVYVTEVKTRAEKRLTEDAYDDTSPQWSPDGKMLAFLRSGPKGGIYTMAAPDAGGTPALPGVQPARIAESAGNNLYGVGISGYAWSPDGKWIAFARRDALDTRDIWIVPSAGGPGVNVTRFPGENDNPRWTRDGKHLVFGSDRGPGSASNLYALPLEKPKDEPEEMEKPAAPSGGAAAPGTAPPAPMPAPPVEVKIDFDDIHLRAKSLTSGTEGVRAFDATPDSKAVIFVRGSDYWSITLTGGSLTRLTTSGDAGGPPRYTPDGNRFFYLAAGGTVRSVARTGGTPTTLAFTARMELDRRAELAEAFNQFWRHLNTGFYDPEMHGVDWRAVRARYEPLLAHTATREDFAMLLSYMVGELNASHSEVSPASSPGGVTTAFLGLEFDENYPGPGLKITRVMPQGPTDRDPNRVAVGEFILSVDGTDVRYDEAFYKALHDKAGRTVELLVNGKPEKEGARTLKLKPIALAELGNLDYERRVKEARKKVEELSGGRLAYIHIRNMDQASLQRFERELYGDAQLKDGLVLDVRHNGGGNIHDNLIGPLSRRVYGYTQPRDSIRSAQPIRHWSKPIILLINQQSASDAEIFPYGFRALKLGKIVGMPTPGYVIGTYGGQLIDGTSYRIPMWGWFTHDGKNMENNGIWPDIVVESEPDDVAAGRDGQLEVAVRELVKELDRKQAVWR